MVSYIKTFPVDTSRLSIQEKKVVEKLTAVAKRIVPLYEAQKNPKYPGANFYPPDATREEIEQAAKKNPAILSPYTFVERNKKGALVTIPYSKKFKKELTQIARLLKEAADLIGDKVFKAYLLARVQDLLRDNFNKSNILWLKTADSKIGFVIGPFDRYEDKLFFTKRVYTAWVGILDEKQTKEMEKLRLAVLSAERKHLPGAKQALVANMNVRVEDVPVFAGAEADSLFTAHNLPASADVEFIKKHGTVSPIFKQVIDLRFSQWILPFFEAFFTANLQKNYGEADLERAFTLFTVFVEICHSKMRYDDAPERLQEFYPYFDEVYPDILSIKTSALLYLKGVLSEKDLQTIILGEICQGLYYLGLHKEKPHLDGFTMGYVLFLDSLLESGALTQGDQKKFSVDFHKAFIAIDELSHIFEYYLSLASREDAREFLDQVDVARVLATFDPYIEGVRKRG